MRSFTTAILVAGITTASVVGLHQTGMLIPALSKAEQVGVTVGIIPQSSNSIIVGLDITTGREHELVKDKQAIDKMIHKLGTGDYMTIYLIHSRAESEQEEIFSVVLPDNIGPMGQILQRKKSAAVKEWNICWQEKVMPLVHNVGTQLKLRTDLFGFLRFIAHQKTEFLEKKKAWVILFTDGQHVGDGFNMEKRAPHDSDLDRANQADFIPPLNNVRLIFLGMTPTHRISNDHWRQIQKFWKAYGNASGAKYTSVSSERNLSIR